MIRSAKLACGGAVALMLLGGMICPAMAETNTDSAYGRVEQRIIENNPDFDIQLKYGLNGYAVNDRGSVIRLDIVCDTPILREMCLCRRAIPRVLARRI